MSDLLMTVSYVYYTGLIKESLTVGSWVLTLVQLMNGSAQLWIVYDMSMQLISL